MMKLLIKKFFGGLEGVFSYEEGLPIRYVISFFIFIVLLTCCFGGYFTYSFCPCGMVEFTLVYALVAWLRTFMVFLRTEKFSIYIRKSGDVYLKTLRMLIVEVVREFSRPLALTVRLTVNVLVGHVIRIILFQLVEFFVGIQFVWLTIFAIMIECFVFFIQSYIFSRLIYLYLREWDVNLNFKVLDF